MGCARDWPPRNGETASRMRKGVSLERANPLVRFCPLPARSSTTHRAGSRPCAGARSRSDRRARPSSTDAVCPALHPGDRAGSAARLPSGRWPLQPYTENTLRAFVPARDKLRTATLHARARGTAAIGPPRTAMATSHRAYRRPGAASRNRQRRPVRSRFGLRKQRRALTPACGANGIAGAARFAEAAGANGIAGRPPGARTRRRDRALASMTIDGRCARRGPASFTASRERAAAEAAMLGLRSGGAFRPRRASARYRPGTRVRCGAVGQTASHSPADHPVPPTRRPAYPQNSEEAGDRRAHQRSPNRPPVRRPERIICVLRAGNLRDFARIQPLCPQSGRRRKRQCAAIR